MENLNVRVALKNWQLKWHVGRNDFPTKNEHKNNHKSTEWFEEHV